MIDTLATSRKLKLSGFELDQAEALAEVIADSESIEIKLINKKIDGLDNKIEHKFEKVDERFEKIDERFEKIDERFEKIDERFEKIDERFKKLEDKLDSKIDGIKSDMSTQFKWMVGLIFLSMGFFGALITVLKFFL